MVSDLLAQRARAITSIEVFGSSPRGASEHARARTDGRRNWRLESEPGPLAAAVREFALEHREMWSEPGEPTGSIRVRLSAAADDGAVLGIAVWTGEGADHSPIVRHVAAVLDPVGLDTAHLYVNMREGALFAMGNLTRDHHELRRSELSADELYFGAWQAYCCGHAPKTRECREIPAARLQACRDENRIGVVCREAYHCSGAECFCCSNGLDAACDMDGAEEVEMDMPETRRPSAPTVWSPY